MKRKKKYRLKKWVKDLILTILIMGVLVALFMLAIIGYEDKAQECDEYYGRVCSIYEVDQYHKGIRR